MKQVYLLLSFVMFSQLGWSQTNEETDIEAVKNVMRQYYWDVMYTNDERKDIAAIAEGFHEDFHMYVYYNEEVSVRTREKWMDILQKNRDKAKAKPTGKPKNKNSLEFGLVDVDGQTAIAKLLISSNGKLKYTDYFTLYKIDGDWKVMTKLFTFHQQ